MRIQSFKVDHSGPIKTVSVAEMADVVVLAGPNGVGKTSILNAILNLARAPRPSANIQMVVEATTEEERQRWKKSMLNTSDASDAQMLSVQLRRNQRRNQYKGSFLNFDSDRAVRNAQSFGFSWDITNPFSEDVGWDVGFNQLHSRFDDVRHSLFRLVEHQRREIAEKAIKMREQGDAQMALDFPDVLQPFKEAFRQLLAPKELVDVNVRTQGIYYSQGTDKLPLDSLSSGEREVINIVFDFILRGPRDCVIIFDEPELHLHPELSYKLLQSLSRVGSRNQFIFSTHSPEIISASLENTVVFVSPPKDGVDNQAIIVHRDDATHHALQALGQSIGVISLGKRLVLIEGEEASLDKQTYGSILQNRFPEFVLVPVGGKESIRSFEDLRDNVLEKTIWGVSFFMLCDRDATHALGADSIAKHKSPRLRQLPRYHIENYFLDAETLARAFGDMEQPESWLRDWKQIEARLREIAQSVIPYAVALNVSSALRHKVGNISLMPKGIDGSWSSAAITNAIEGRAQDEQARLSSAISSQGIATEVAREFERLSRAVHDGTWRAELPGRPILNQFAASAKIQAGRLKQLYLARAEHGTLFSEIIDIFSSFRHAAL